MMSSTHILIKILAGFIILQINLINCRIYHNRIQVEYKDRKAHENMSKSNDNISQIQKLISWNFGFIKGGSAEFSMSCPLEV